MVSRDSARWLSLANTNVSSNKVPIKCYKIGKRPELDDKDREKFINDDLITKGKVVINSWVGEWRIKVGSVPRRG